MIQSNVSAYAEYCRELPMRANNLSSSHDMEESDLDRMVATLESVCHE